ncbi:dipicolinate synthase subunit B [Natranaerobius trueperi]|nr:dipicolinate synthase subunit B [Natranaerobius trueperi]
MTSNKLSIAFGVTGAYHQLETALQKCREIEKQGHEVTPVLSPSVSNISTKFGSGNYWYTNFQKVTKRPPITDIVGAEPFGPHDLSDLMVILPCTGATLARIANGLNEHSVSLAAKAHLRTQKPIIIAVSTNDGLSLNSTNIAKLLNMSNVYFVPFGQDNPVNKPDSLMSDFRLLWDSVECALKGEQLQPVLKEFSN